jgi:hypothetical protein
MPDTSAELSDEELLYLVGTTDAELFAAGVDIKRRSFEVPRQVMHKLGYAGFIFAGAGTPSIYDRIYRTFSSIYRPQDLAIGGHIGVFMYRDIFARIAVPHVYREVSINPFKFVELTPVQLRIIQTEPDQMEIFLDQCGDVADIQYGVDELNEPYASNELVRRFIGLARLHLHSASAVLTGGYDFRGAVQASLLAVELGLKAGAAAHGMPEGEIRQKFGHRVSDIAGHLAALVVVRCGSHSPCRLCSATICRQSLLRFPTSSPGCWSLDYGRTVRRGRSGAPDVGSKLPDIDERPF